MNPTNLGPLAPATVPFSAALECRLAPIADAGSGAVRGLDLRLWRQINSPLAGGVYAATAAGFRVPPHSVRALGLQLIRQADLLGLP